MTRDTRDLDGNRRKYSANRTAARYYARHFGWHILPAVPCGKPPLAQLVAHGLKDATRDPYLIDQWWTQFPTANVAVRTGWESDIVVLDIDAGGEDSIAALEAEYGLLPATLQCLTGGGGRHLYFRHPGRGIRIKTRARIRPGLDVRGDGGYVIAPPSKHAAGGEYKWILDPASASPFAIDNDIFDILLAGRTRS